MRKYKQKPVEQRKIALERIKELFEQAKDICKTDSRFANRYIHLARKISMKVKVPIPRELKRRFCRHCGNYFIAGKNLRVRLTNKKVVYCCLDCKKFYRMPYVKEIKAKRQQKDSSLR